MKVAVSEGMQRGRGVLARWRGREEVEEEEVVEGEAKHGVSEGRVGECRGKGEGVVMRRLL